MNFTAFPPGKTGVKSDDLAERPADDLVAQGRYLDAIEYLTALNREKRDGRIEARLVELRRDAFDELERLPTRRNWPPDYHDPLPGVTDLVEIHRSQLTADLLGAVIRYHGCLLVRRFLDRKTAEHLRQIGVRAFAGLAAYRNGMPTRVTAPWYVPLPPHPKYPARHATLRHNGTGARILFADSPRLTFEAIEALRACGWSEVVRDYFGCRPVLSENKWSLLKYSRREATKAWHQEVAAFPPVPIRALNLWLALTRCGENAPGLQVYPKQVGRLIPPAKGYFLDERRIHKAVGSSLPTTPVFEAGDALIFDQYALHATYSTPEMTETRFAMESWFFSATEHPRELGTLVF